MTDEKCPSCGDKDTQRNVGQVQSKHHDKAHVAITLYRCAACSFLYTVPKLEETKEQSARHGKGE